MYYRVENEEMVEGYIAETTNKGRQLTTEEIRNFLAGYYKAPVEFIPEDESILQNFTDEDVLEYARGFSEERYALTETGMQYPEDGDEFDRWYSGRQPLYRG